MTIRIEQQSYDIFIAYHLFNNDENDERSSYKKALQLKNMLERLGYKCFLKNPKSRTGGGFDKTVNDATQSKLFLFVINEGVKEKCEEIFVADRDYVYDHLRGDTRCRQEIEAFIRKFENNPGIAKFKMLCHCDCSRDVISDFAVGQLHYSGVFACVIPTRTDAEVADWAIEQLGKRAVQEDIQPQQQSQLSKPKAKSQEQKSKDTKQDFQDIESNIDELDNEDEYIEDIEVEEELDDEEIEYIENEIDEEIKKQPQASSDEQPTDLPNTSSESLTKYDGEDSDDYLSQFEFKITGDGIEILKYIGKDTEVKIPEYILGKKVTSIGSRAFYDRISITSIEIPSGVTSIGDWSFYNCSSLTNIEIPSGVTSIGDWSFYDCSSLTNIEIPSGVTSIGSRAFCNCSSLTSIEIPSGVTNIGDRAFFGCISLTSIEMPSSVTSIGVFAFYNCRGLIGVYITDIASWCAIEFGLYSNPLYYAHNLYLNNKLVTELMIPYGVTSIGDYAFSGCSGLTSVDVPRSVISIGNWAFWDCSSITSIAIPSGVTSICRSVFNNCSSLTSIEIPDSVTIIGDYAFYGCYNLTIYCEAKKRQSGWNRYWRGWILGKKPKVVWDCKNKKKK